MKFELSLIVTNISITENFYPNLYTDGSRSSDIFKNPSITVFLIWYIKYVTWYSWYISFNVNCTLCKTWYNDSWYIVQTSWFNKILIKTTLHYKVTSRRLVVNREYFVLSLNFSLFRDAFIFKSHSDCFSVSKLNNSFFHTLAIQRKDYIKLSKFYFNDVCISVGYWNVTKPFTKKSGSVEGVKTRIERRLREMERVIQNHPSKEGLSSFRKELFTLELSYVYRRLFNIFYASDYDRSLKTTARFLTKIDDLLASALEKKNK